MYVRKENSIMIQSINFMGSKKTAMDKIAKKVEPEIKEFFPSTAPIAPAVKSNTPHGISAGELESYLASRKPLPKDEGSALEKVQAKLAAESYSVSHGNQI